MKKDLGLIHIYCGDGKGKTTSAMGLGFRALGFGLNVCIVQFLKSGKSSELNSFEKFDNAYVVTGKGVLGFTINFDDEAKRKCRIVHDENLEEALKIINNNDIDLVIFDEIIGAINTELIDYTKFMDFLKNKPENLEVVLTGRDPNKELIEMADYVSEVKKIKHPYDKGINARDGIER